jgi:hypothetical protein
LQFEHGDGFLGALPVGGFTGGMLQCGGGIGFGTTPLP